MFLETLVDFIIIHKDDLQDWLFVLLTQLLKKMGADLLGSMQAKVQKALDVTRDSFPFDQQFNILMRFIVDQTQTPNLKVKVAILKYIESLARQMDPTDFVNSSETRVAVSRIVTWTTEPKSSDVRKAAQIVLISLSASRCSAPSSRRLTIPSTLLPSRCRPKSSRGSPRSRCCSSSPTSSQACCRVMTTPKVVCVRPACFA
uniref:Cytoplasmic linker associated protein 1 n=1 Tax=Cebus imitator TaxID=2715852 RepID=A0A2K5SCQ0_CEBIM